MFGWIGEKWESSRVRLWINENPKLVVAVVCVSALVLVLAVIPLFRGSSIERIAPSDYEWYYDLNTEELFVGAKGLKVPREAPSGPLPNGEPAGVRACVLSYVLDPDESERFIGYLEKPEPNARGDEGKLVRRVVDVEWFSAESAEGKVIIAAAFVADVDGERPSYVRVK